MKEYEYYDKNGELVCALGKPIEDLIEEYVDKDRYIIQLETMVTQLKFKYEKLQNRQNNSQNS